MHELIRCTQCRRHVRAGSSCPFCARRPAVASAGVAAMVAATVATATCNGTEQQTIPVVPIDQATPPADTAAAPAASAEPTAVASAAPAAIASATPTAIASASPTATPSSRPKESPDSERNDRPMYGILRPYGVTQMPNSG